ncbi:MAG: flagellar basal body rod protein FlgC [Deltaproteobacteria bacterium HGW-Deltaproteobacteria-7]|jgi:flagellar basal-body rod protein FlgC|nr:MAG: flagellar basal body rod protein FlgC [Deltaproteobacteria bacterium HGW-Deltaproteobacteria-7]PKN20798.1 MAG: flagellar basal body rod protein FlgC [Deltaproteobacteria bacterium HGW-Deltaproteobacteria-6]
MEDFTAFKIAGSGLSAQRKKMDVVSSNIANVMSTSTPEGGPYKRKIMSFAADPLEKDFDSNLKKALNAVKVDKITEDREGLKTIYDPAHPDANKDGFVTLPNVSLMVEMTEMITAARAYEANATVIDATKNMAMKAMDIGK